jgi:hypothetical protein
MVIKISSMDDMVITITAIPIVTTTELKTTTMTCGDCNVDDMVCALLLFLCIYGGVLGAFHIGTDGGSMVGSSVLGEGDLINRWEHSVWWSRFL